MKKILLLDVDGVVVDSKRFSEKYKEITGLDIKDKLTSFFNNIFPNCQVGTSDLLSELEKVRESWGWKGSAKDLLTIWLDADDYKLNSELLAAVQKFRAAGIECYLATNQEKYRADYLWDELGLNCYFEDILASCYLGERKPSPEYFEKVITRLGVKPEEIYFFDDGNKNVAMARDLGINAYLYNSVSEIKAKLV